ncbi:MAG: GYD domain-containing protein [Ignavibacteriae bacterium]|nr:GYD domain-containing protein [Ignavibacteriota bacterium]MCB9211747.1 GYD domain-containing protein [Ignavibacteriales bacterium]
MATYILLTKLSPDESKKVHNRAKLGHVWLEEVKAKCPEANFISHYALLGRYDFMDIYEAPNEKVAAKVSMISLANGAYTSESITAIPYKEFTELLSEL